LFLIINIGGHRMNLFKSITSHRIAISTIFSGIFASISTIAQTSFPLEEPAKLIKIVEFSNNSSPTTPKMLVQLSPMAFPGLPYSVASSVVIIRGQRLCTTEMGDRIYSEYCGWPWPSDDGGGNTGGGNSNMPGGGGGSSSPTLPTKPQAKAECQKALGKQDRTDKMSIFKNESPTLRTRGYILPSFPNAGVTIGYGVDLGARTRTELEAWGMSQEGIQKVKPFLGKRGQSIQKVLDKFDLPVITANDALVISNGVFNQIYDKTSRDYSSQSTAGISFQELPEPAQTVIMDIAYNGIPSIKAPKFWNNVITGQWSDAVGNLTAWFGDGTSDERHIKAAKLLADAILAGKLPEAASGKCQ
jgi:hypothetical protein